MTNANVVEHHEAIERMVQAFRTTQFPQLRSEDMITPLELRKTILRLPKRKAPGKDGIVNPNKETNVAVETFDITEGVEASNTVIPQWSGELQACVYVCGFMIKKLGPICHQCKITMLADQNTERIMDAIIPQKDSDTDSDVSVDNTHSMNKRIVKQSYRISDSDSSSIDEIPESPKNIQCTINPTGASDLELDGDNEITRIIPRRSKRKLSASTKSTFHKRRALSAKPTTSKIGQSKTSEKVNKINNNENKVNPIQKVKTVNKNKTQNLDWKKDVFLHEVHNIRENVFSQPERIRSPIEYFKLFFTDKIIRKIREQSTLYAFQTSTKNIALSIQDIQDFLAIELLMGIIQLPAYSDYWSSKTRIEQVAQIMSLKKYELIRRYLHFNNNENIENSSDRYFKIRPLVEAIRKNCNKIEEESRMSIDEMMIPYKGKKAGNLRQYVKPKPKKWGYKLFVRSGVSGFVYDFLLYGGESTFQGITFKTKEKSMGLGAKVILTLCRTMHNPVLSVVYFDNFFSSIKLMTYLRDEMGILSIATFRQNRIRKCDLESDKTIKTKPRGFADYRICEDQKIIMVKWLDNKPVLIASTYVGLEPMGVCNRYSKDAKGFIEIPCPKIINEYNKHMGGVDLSDMLIAIYRTYYKTHKWYMAIFSQLLDISVNNAWLLYRREYGFLTNDDKYLRLKDFRLEIVQGLLAQKERPLGIDLHSVPGPPSRNKIINPIKVRPAEETRYDGNNHYPIVTSKGRCRKCNSGKTTFMCTKCEMRLCIKKDRNCFIISRSMTEQEKCGEASLRISWTLAKHMKPFTDADVVKECFLEAGNALFENKKHVVEPIRQIPSSASTSTRNTHVLAKENHCDLKRQLNNANYYALAMDESYDKNLLTMPT
ncbi:unnamed protein product [Euphydryas editha]|uniref:PiggyBac transposable element-derived protein domain-containing protein n=1 Tax=Euphydryas editha TaxID=104508 RepID=A0AAU9UQ64_EUPED|nr:unnamed protein product [Euphydryas editha]